MTEFMSFIQTKRLNIVVLLPFLAGVVVLTVLSLTSVLTMCRLVAANIALQIKDNADYQTRMSSDQ